MVLEVIKPIKKKQRNAKTSVATIVGPTGVPITIAVNKPRVAQTTEIMTEDIVTLLKLLKTRIALNAGKSIKADISKEPTRFIASTIMTAVIIAIMILNNVVLTPVALAKLSSKVTANILL